ncbi:ATP-binding protein [Thalassotalea sp. SU-HH00458]|uniref:ATP-binding protein n=1 Tax=Thalassotalea sp. SU-HH00458 TaxID=3127657 RepID=UPI0031034E4A
MRRFSFALYVFISIFVAGLATYFTNIQIVESYNQTLEEDFDINIQEVDTHIARKYNAFKDDILFLYSTPPISGLTRSVSNNGIDPLDGTTTALWKSWLSNIFSGFMENNHEYFQLRIINATGKEFLRVDRINQKVVVRANNDLQDKGDRYYFTETASLPEEQMYVSVIDLNRERGQITFPYQPTLRLAIPIYNDDNQFFGIIIANIDMTKMLEELDHLVTDKYGIILADVEGHFIKHPSEAYQFSRDLAPHSMFDNTYTLEPVLDSSLSKYRNGDKVSLGMSTPFVVAAHERGGRLHTSILMSDTIYKKELNNRRVESFFALLVGLTVAIVLLYLMHRNNQRLSRLLSLAEEAKAAVDVAEDAVITVDPKWKINTVNRAFEQLFLSPFDDVKGQSVAEFFSNSGDNELASRISQAKGKFDYSGYDWKFESIDGSSKWLHTKVARIPMKQSNAAYAIAVSDITGEKQALENVESINIGLEQTIAERTQELAKARDKAIEVSDLKSNFISTISHEMRTPLNGIVGATSLLKKEMLNNKQVKLVQMAENSVEALRHLINDVLDLSKIEAGKLEFDFRNFNPEALIESITSTMSVVANEKNLGFYIDTNKLRFASINNDPHRLAQVLNNFLNNAIKFTDNGYIAVTAWSDIKETSSYLHVEVKDTGVGIAESKLDKLFKAFTQADNTVSAKYGGTGLGLSISKEIINLMGGSVSVSSVEGQGSTFSFEIPIESWEAKNNDVQTRLSGLNIGMLINTPPLINTITNLIINSGGEIMEFAEPFTSAALEPMPVLLVDIEHSNYNQFVAFWNDLPDKVASQTRLIVLSKLSQSVVDLPKGAVNLVKPIYRSTFLANVLNDRQAIVNYSKTIELERRSTDISLENEDALIDNINCNVLVVDDNEINTEVARFILEPLGANVEIAINGVKAISALQDASEPFDIILMDCNMPVMNGYDATSAIRNGQAGEKYKSIPILAATANAMKGESEKCYEAGMNDYITKPLDPSVLVSKISNLVTKEEINGSGNLTESESNLTSLPTMPDNETLWQKEAALLRLGGREKLLKQIIQLFLDSYEDRINSIFNAISNKDREQLRMAAHAFKGNCGDIGAAALHKTLNDIESLSKSMKFSELESLLEQVKNELDDTLVLINAYLADKE